MVELVDQLPMQPLPMPDVMHLAGDAPVALVVFALTRLNVGFAVGEELEEGAQQLGMAAAVIAFAVVLHDDLPIAVFDDVGLEGDTAIGEVMRAGAIGLVASSNNDEFTVGDMVQGAFGWQDWAVSDGGGLFPVAKVPAGVPPTAMLGVLGPTGLTAYFGLLDVGQPQEDDTVLVSAAAGATGSIAGQIARVLGCRVIGIAGGEEKCAWVRDVAGYDRPLIDEVRRINLKQNLAGNPDAQRMEDALCLTFLEFEFEEFCQKYPAEKVVDVVRKTWRKMSVQGHELALGLPYTATSRALIQRALAPAAEPGD